MKRIVIIEGHVRGIAAESPRQDVLTIDINDVDTDTIAVPCSIGEVIALEAYRKNVRVVVEIGTEDTLTQESSGDPLYRGKPTACLTREELIHALAAARHAADEYRHENAALVKSNEGLQADFDAMAAKNDELLEKIASGPEAFDPEKHITKATVCEWLEEDASSSDQASSVQRKLKNPMGAQLLAVSANDTRVIIDRINSHEDSL